MSQVRCNGCRVFFDKFLRVCPECDRARPEFNVHMAQARVNEGLNAAARRAHANR